MKKLILIILIFSSLNAFSQYLSVKTASSGIFLEKERLNLYRNTDQSVSATSSLIASYRLGPKSIITLKSGLEKALNWIKLNEIHNKSFEKNICNFRVMKKADFLKSGYSQWNSKEMTLSFKGHESGSYNLLLLVESNFPTPNNPKDIFEEFYSKEQIQELIDELDEKSESKEINEIFK